MKTLMIFIVTLIALTQLSYAQWNTHELEKRIDLNSVCFRNTDLSILACDNGILLSTSDAGNTWSKHQFPTTANLNSINFIDNDYGFVVGDNGRIYKSDVNYSEWLDRSIEEIFYLNDVALNEIGHVVVAGKKKVRLNGSTYFLTSINVSYDQGINWNEIQFNQRGCLNSVTYVYDGLIIAVGDEGVIYKSTDNGLEWFQQETYLSSNFNSVQVCPDYELIICGDNGTLLYSEDLGESWSSVNLPDYYHLKNACFVTNGIVVVSGTMEVRIDGNLHLMAVLLRIRIDTGDWNEELCEIRGKYNSVSFCNPNTAIAVGDRGQYAIYDISTTLNENDDLTVNLIELNQNFPNPFNPSTKIQWKLPIAGNVKLILYNSLGEELETIVDEYLNAGIHSKIITLNSEFPSGVYFYQLKTGESVETKKMILIK